MHLPFEVLQRQIRPRRWLVQIQPARSKALRQYPLKRVAQRRSYCEFRLQNFANHIPVRRQINTNRAKTFRRPPPVTRLIPVRRNLQNRRDRSTRGA